MLPDLYKYASDLVCVILTGIAVKIMDDYLDYEQDEKVGIINLTKWLGKGGPVYGMLLLVFATCLNIKLAASLFIASYCIGMMSGLGQKLPSGLRAWMEIIVVLLIANLMLDWQLLILALGAIWVIQVIDDWVDERTDQLSGADNFIHRLGLVETLIFTLIIFLFLVWYIDWYVMTIVLIGYAVLSVSLWIINTRRGPSA